MTGACTNAIPSTRIVVVGGRYPLGLISALYVMCRCASASTGSLSATCCLCHSVEMQAARVSHIKAPGGSDRALPRTHMLLFVFLGSSMLLSNGFCSLLRGPERYMHEQLLSSNRSMRYIISFDRLKKTVMWVALASGVIDGLCALRGMLKCLFACVCVYIWYMI